jgi:hypothetical protein
MKWGRDFRFLRALASINSLQRFPSGFSCGNEQDLRFLCCHPDRPQVGILLESMLVVSATLATWSIPSGHPPAPRSAEPPRTARRGVRNIERRWSASAIASRDKAAPAAGRVAAAGAESLSSVFSLPCGAAPMIGRPSSPRDGSIAASCGVRSSACCPSRWPEARP